MYASNTLKSSWHIEFILFYIALGISCLDRYGDIEGLDDMLQRIVNGDLVSFIARAVAHSSFRIAFSPLHCFS